MPCGCQQCLHHAQTLGLAPKPPAPSAVRKAFRSEAKLWHPDRFEKTPTKRAEAEEHFKRIQVAYRELLEHCESPVELWPRRASAQPADREQDPLRADRSAPGDDSVPLSFGGAPYCFVPPHFSPYANEIILASRLENAEKVLAFIDVPGGTSRGATRGEYILLTSYRIFVRDAVNISSFLWFTDLGDVLFVDRNKHGKPRIWQWILELFPDIEPRFALLIYRRNQTLLYSLAATDDTVKKVIYNFLLQKKSQTRS